MFGSVITMLTRSIGASLYWLTSFFNSLGVVGFFLGVFTLFCVFRLLLKPLMGSGSSDRVKKKNKEE